MGHGLRDGIMNVRRTQTFAAFGAALLASACASQTLVSDQPRVAPSQSVGQSASGYYLAARHAEFEGKLGLAKDYYARAIAGDPNNPSILERAFLNDILLGDVASGADVAQRMVAIDSTSRMAHLVLSIAAMKDARFADSEAQIDAASGKDKADIVWATIKTWALAGGGRGDQAIALIASKESRTNFGAFALYHEALLRDFLGQDREANEAYARALKATQSRSVRLVEAYGRFLARHGRAAQAAELYDNVAKLDPGNPLIANLSAQLKGKHSAGDAMISSASEGAAEALYGMAVVLMGDHDPVLPLVYTQLALHLRPHFDIGLALRGELYEAQESWDVAARSFALIPASSPVASLAAISIARDLAHLKQYDDAGTMLRARLRADANDHDALIALGDIYRTQQKWSEAAGAYSRALDTQMDGPDRWQILYARGVALERSGNWPEAEPLLQKALSLRPNEPQLLNYLGYSWIDRGEHLKEALALLSKAAAARPDDGFIIDSLGWAYYRLGDYTNAAKYLERAVELAPADPTINDHLGDAYWRVGRRREAHFQWTHALDLKPDASDLKAITKKLGGGLTEPGEKKGSKS